MKRIYTVVLIGLGFTLTSCNATAHTEAVVFPETISLQGEEKAI